MWTSPSRKGRRQRPTDRETRPGPAARHPDGALGMSRSDGLSGNHGDAGRKEHGRAKGDAGRVSVAAGAIPDYNDPSRPVRPDRHTQETPGMEPLQSDSLIVGEDLLRLERAERRFHREVNERDYLSWKQLFQRVRLERRYRFDYFGMPRVTTGDELLGLAHQTLLERSCTYVQELREVGPEYVIPVEDHWQTHTDPETGRTLANGGDEDYWDLSFFIGDDGEEPDEDSMAFTLELAGLQVDSTLEEAIAKRCEETGVTDPEAATLTLWAVRKAVARTLVLEDGERMTLRQRLFMARARAEEVFDRVYGLARIRRAGVDLDEHPEWKYLQTFFDAGMLPPTHQEAADTIIGMFGRDAAEPE